MARVLVVGTDIQGEQALDADLIPERHALLASLQALTGCNWNTLYIKE